MSGAGHTSSEGAAPPTSTSTCWTATYHCCCASGTCIAQFLLRLRALLMALPGARRVVHALIPSMCIPPKVDRMVVNRITNRGALTIEMIFVALLLLGASVAQLGFHTWDHLPALRAAGLMPEPPAQNASVLSVGSITNASTINTSSITNATNSTQEPTRVSLALAIGDILMKWLSPRRIDIIQRCTYTCFFLATGFAVWLFLCMSCAIRHKVDSQVLNVDTLHEDVRWWWVPCHQAIMHLSFVAVINLALYPLRAPFIKPWESWDAALYVLQAWYVLLMIGFQWCALGGLKKHEPVRSRMMASPDYFFLEELLSAGGTFIAVLFMVCWLCIPMFATVIAPGLGLEEKQPKLPTGCRLSWQSDTHSWYSCSSLANATTHQRIIVSLAFMAAGALGSVIWAFACYCTAIAGRQRQQQTWCEWARDAFLKLVNALSKLCKIALAVMLKQADLSHDEQEPQLQSTDDNQQQALLLALNFFTELDRCLQSMQEGQPLEAQATLPGIKQQCNAVAARVRQLAATQGQDGPGVNAALQVQQQQPVRQGDIRTQAIISNTAFAKYWWRLTAAAYLGMGFHGAYCMTIILLQGQQIDPFRLQNESSWVYGTAMLLWLMRTYFGVMAWRAVAHVREHHDE